MDNLVEKVKNYIDSRRTISFENLCNYFEFEKNELEKIVRGLESNKAIRFVTRGCSFDCSSCSTSTNNCGEVVPKNTITSNTIMISLKL